MSKGRILVVDDEAQIRRVMKSMLVTQGYEVADSLSGEDALERIHTEKYDLVLLDINLPGITGVETCREIRTGSDVPIIMMTVRNSERDKVEALDAGADDYVTKPFGSSEMLARIRAGLRRTETADSAPLRLKLGNTEINFESRQVITRGERVHLTPKEFDLLSYFAAHPNQAISHQELLRAVWGPDYGDEQEYLRVFINRLRKKIEPTPKNPKYLITEPWTGYRLQLAGD
jgi:two-component system, OmpR family, KDP operon response regulator KdpE